MPVDGCDIGGCDGPGGCDGLGGCDGVAGCFDVGAILSTSGNGRKNGKGGGNGLAIIFGIAVVAAVVGVGAYVLTGSSDKDEYGEKLAKLRTEFAEASVAYCGDGAEASERNGRIYESVLSDLKKYEATKGGWRAQKAAFETLQLAQSFDNMVLYPATFTQRNLYAFDSGVKGILYNEGEEKPVFVYGGLQRAQFDEIIDTINERGLPQGNAVVLWNNVDKEYQIIDVPAGQDHVEINHNRIEIKTNPCHFGDGVTGVGTQILKDKLRGLIPGGG